MPFAYYGAKHGLAPKYPRPRHGVIVEPFAGSAAYSVYHAARIDHAILIDSDERLVDLWHELQQMTERDVDLIGKQIDGDKFSHALLAGMAGSETMKAVLGGKTRQVTPRMRTAWPSVRTRIVRALPHIKRWTIKHGTYSDAPDVEATWFVDPPYQVNGTAAGSLYRVDESGIDFAHLSDWCRNRRGYCVVCEQSPASWLPFHPFASQQNGASRGDGSSTRVEVIWRSDFEQPDLFTGVA